MVLSLVLTIVVFIQSCAVAFGGSLTEDEDMAGGGGIGILVALLWIVGAGLVIGLPRAAMWVFGVAAFFGLLGSTAGGFPDLWIWTVVSVIFSLMSWRGIKEKQKKDAQTAVQHEANLATVAALQAQEAGTVETSGDGSERSEA